MQTPITDAGLRELKNLESLTTLDLGDTAITYVGVAQLTNLKSLKSLDLSGTLITDNGVWALKKSLPNLEISHY